MAAVTRTVTLAACLLALLASACYAAPTVVESRQHPGLKLTYQQTRLCEVTPGVKTYSGYIFLPATLDPALQPYDASLFFWFFESRLASGTAPLTLWIQGGPGQGSVNQAVSGHNGPCKVQHDSNSTVPNLFSWNDVSNMLYLDEPVQTGFSYDVVTDGYRDMLTGQFYPGAMGPGNVTYRHAKAGSQNPTHTMNTTAIGAKAMAHFLDLWFQQFPKYKRDSVNIWYQSYGGHYAPALAKLLLQQGKIGVSSVGIINGVIDALIQTPYYPQFAVNNTYGIKAYSDDVAAYATNSFYKPGGCQDQANLCRAQQAMYDPNSYGNNATLDNICLGAVVYCLTNVYGPYEAYSGRNPFDIAHLIPDSFPPPFATGYLNNAWVQTALGAAVNFTETSPVANNAQFLTGDYSRGYTAEIGHLLDRGVRVALLHGDRDMRCNWFGGEAVSLAVPYGRAARFAAAGYADIRVPGLSAPAGLVRQHGGFSFGRIFQAGHEMPYYQPGLAVLLFTRTLLGLDVATGLHPATNNYSTSGPANVRDVGVGAPSPPQDPVECYVDAAPLANAPSRCTGNQLAALAAGTALINADRIVVSPAA